MTYQIWKPSNGFFRTVAIRNSVDEFNSRIYQLRIDQSQEGIQNVALNGKLMGGTEKYKRHKNK